MAIEEWPSREAWLVRSTFINENGHGLACTALPEMHFTDEYAHHILDLMENLFGPYTKKVITT